MTPQIYLWSHEALLWYALRMRVQANNLRCFFLCLLLISSSACSFLGSSSPTEQAAVYHEVKAGETLASISKAYGISLKRLRALNGLSEQSRLKVGQRLQVGYGVQNASLRMQGKGELAWPLLTGRVLSLFGPRNSSFHDGLDIAAPVGTPIFAAHSGVVVYSDSGLSGYGKLVILRHKSGLLTVYAHNSRLLVDEGEEVRKGMHIADVGATGRASGPHLHFEVRSKDKNGRYVAVDPLPLLNGRTNEPLRYRVNDSLRPIFARLF